MNVLAAIYKESSSEGPQSHISNLRGQSGQLKLVADFNGVVYGSKLKNVREFKASIEEIQETANEEKK